MDMSAKRWALIGISVAAVLGLVGLGFASMSTNPPFIVHPIVPLLFFIAAGLVAVGTVVYLLVTRNKEIKSKTTDYLSDIKADLIAVNKCERQEAVKKTKEQYTEKTISRLKSDFTEYVTKSTASLVGALTDLSNKERILDALIKFFTGIADILDSSGHGLKTGLSGNEIYNNAKESIAQKQQLLAKNKKILTQKNIRKVSLLTYGLNSTILLRHIYRLSSEFQDTIPSELNVLVEGIERETEKILTEMLNNLDMELENVLKIDFQEI